MLNVSFVSLSPKIYEVRLHYSLRIEVKAAV